MKAYQIRRSSMRSKTQKYEGLAATAFERGSGRDAR
jgi:hypothetical protein